MLFRPDLFAQPGVRYWYLLYCIYWRCAVYALVTIIFFVTTAVTISNVRRFFVYFLTAKEDENYLLEQDLHFRCVLEMTSTLILEDLPSTRLQISCYCLHVVINTRQRKHCYFINHRCLAVLFQHGCVVWPPKKSGEVGRLRLWQTGKRRYQKKNRNWPRGESTITNTRQPSETTLRCRCSDRDVCVTYGHVPTCSPSLRCAFGRKLARDKTTYNGYRQYDGSLRVFRLLPRRTSVHIKLGSVTVEYVQCVSICPFPCHSPVFSVNCEQRCACGR